jgi:hypothetical protein
MSAINFGAETKPIIVVLGYIIKGPISGNTWCNLQYILGLRKLGFDVYFVEDSGNSHWCCYDPQRHVTDSNPNYGLKFAKKIFDHFSLSDKWAYYDYHSSSWYGPCSENILRICETADLLIHIAGSNPLRSWHMNIAQRIFIDQDPAFTQIKNLTNRTFNENVMLHTGFFSFGENIKTGHSRIPSDGISWNTTRQPVVLTEAIVGQDTRRGKFTTVMHWNPSPGFTYRDIYYGNKADSFGPYIDLPEKVGEIIEIALGSPSDSSNLLTHKGWLLRDPLEVTKDLNAYLRYIRESKAEFSVAQHGYVVSNSGWFSERSVAYLSSGRPVVVQDTGFSSWLETGLGVLAFNNPDEAIAGIESVNSNYKKHCRAARDIAREYFDSDKVLSKLLDDTLN